METLEKLDDVVMTTSEIYDVAEIYEQTFPAVAKYISSKGGSFEDAKDIFHDALLIFIEKKSEAPINIIKSDCAYILGISKHLWINKYKKDRFKIPLNRVEIEIPDNFYPTANNERLLNLLKIGGKRCLDLLRAFYFQQFSIKELVNNLGYSNEHSASVQKYKCLEKVRNKVKEKALNYDDFKE